MSLAKKRLFLAVLIIFAVISRSGPLFAQQPLDRNLVYDRLIAIVPMMGAGTYEDPRRPAYVPDYLLGEGVNKTSDFKADGFASPVDAALAQEAIISFSYELSDDEQFAIVTFQATDSSAFEPLFKAAENPGASTEGGPNRNALEGGFDLKVFEVGKVDRKQIETELRKQKKDLTLDNVGVSLQ